MARVLAALRMVHPAPAIAVVGLTTVLAAILSNEAGAPALDARVLLVALSVLASKNVTGVMNDCTDREHDALTQPSKPIPAGEARPSTALVLAAVGLALQVGASLTLGELALVLGLLAVGSAL